MINFKSDENKNLQKEIDLKLSNFNKSQNEWFRNKAYKTEDKNFYAYDEEKLIGGAIGFVCYSWYYLDLLFVEDAYRKKGIGSQLLKQIEQFAKENHLTGVRMETWDFQALGFYQSNGYKVFGEIKDCPPGTIEYHLKKEL